MKNDDKPTCDFNSEIQALQKPLNEELEPEAAQEVLFHISEVLTDFNRLQHEIFAVVRHSQDGSESSATLSAIVNWFEALQFGWAPHWQTHADAALALLKHNEPEDQDEDG